MFLEQGPHEVTVVPLYLPLVREGEPLDEPVHMGGINMYLQQKTPMARRLPGWVRRLLDRPGLLRWASRRSHMTDAPDLGPMTVSMLKGEHGRQSKELESLVTWMQGQARPDVVLLSNGLLGGVAGRIKEALGVPVVCTLQGEAPFLDALPAPFGAEAWRALSDAAESVDAFVPVSRTYGEVMTQRLPGAAHRMHPILNGIELDDFPVDPSPLAQRVPLTLGYLARLCEEKGFPLLVDAFIELKRRGRLEGLRLRVAGVVLNEDRPLVEAARSKVAEAGFAADFQVLENLERAEKLEFLQSLTVLSVPAGYGESFGLYLLEAMAAGVPVVQPRCGAFPEVVEATGGGVLCDFDASSLADGITAVLADLPAAQQLADTGRATVRERFTAGRMAEELSELCASFGSASDADVP